MMKRFFRIAIPSALLCLAAPMLAADALIVDPVVRAGSWAVTASDVVVGGVLPDGAREGVEASVRRPRTVCYQPGRTRRGRPRSLLEEFAGSPCNAESAAVDGQRFTGKMLCADDITFGSTAYEGSYDATSADVDLTVDMSFKDTDYRMLMTTRLKFEWQGAGCRSGG